MKSYTMRQWEANKAKNLQKEATDIYYKIGIWFTVVYFGGHGIVALLRYLIS